MTMQSPSDSLELIQSLRVMHAQAQRQQQLDTHLKELRRQCILLGEDEGLVAAEVHPSLGASRYGPLPLAQGL